MRKVLMASVAGLVLLSAVPAAAQTSARTASASAPAAWQEGLFAVRADAQKGKVTVRLPAPGAGGVLAAFLAGGVALFAPCCIVFLAPSYLAAAAKNRRWRLLPLTFVFAAGLAVVLVPITLGVSLISGAIAKYHQPLYWAGGLLMIGLGVLALSGRMWSMPSMLRPRRWRSGRRQRRAAGHRPSSFARGC